MSPNEGSNAKSITGLDMRRKPLPLFAVCLIFLCSWSAGADAAVRPMALGDLTAASSVVVHGRVVSLDSRWDEGHRTIHTAVEVEPIDYLKGDASAETIVFEMPGGTVGEIRLVVSDLPSFEVGEEVILFLKDDYFRVVGFFQGKFKVNKGVVVEEGMSVEELRRKVAGAAMGAPEGEWEGHRTGEPLIRPAKFRLPPPTGATNEARPKPRTGDVQQEPGDAASPPTDIGLSPLGTVTIMTEDFESDWPGAGWDLIDQAGTGHLWGVDDYKPHWGSYSMWEASAGDNAVDPEFSNYPHNMGTWARYGPFDLSDATSAELFFYHSVNTAETDDHLYWGSSGDGSAFDGYIASGGIGLWWPQSLDLSAHLGDSTVWIAFLFESDAALNDKGAFVDDVELTKNIVPENPPEITDITPGTGPSGAGFSVTISGAYFGDSQGSSEVRFTKDPVGGTFVNADVVTSWSETSVTCEVPVYASSGPVNVVVDGDPGTGGEFLVTFGGSPNTWQNSEPMGEDLLINPNKADVTDELDAVIAALQVWNTTGGASFSFSYGGASSATTYGYNNLNEVCWGSTGGAVAATYTWLLGDAMMESDLVFDDLWSWSTSTPPAPGGFDVQAVATHEFGHWLRLVDLYGAADEGKTMYGRISFGEYGQRTLEPADKAGSRFLYGDETVNITTLSLPGAEAGVFYSEELTATGGAVPYTWELRLLSLPPGLSLGPDGLISGTPTTTGIYYFNVRATDDNSDKDSQILRMTVTEDATAPAVTVLTPDRGDSLEVGAAYDITWLAADGNGVDSVSVYYSVHGGDGYELIASGEPNDGVYPWTAPAAASESLTVKVIAYDPELNTGQDESDSLNVIYDPTVDAPITRPRAAETARLWQNAPNPFSPETEISFYLPEERIVRLEVFDAGGRLVKAIIAGRAYPAGVHTVSWDGRSRDGDLLGSGVYFYRFKAGDFVRTKKMALAR